MNIHHIRLQRARRAWLVSMILLLIAVIAILISLNTGTIRLSPLRVLYTLLGLGTRQEHMIMFDYRLPRIVITILAGAGIAVAGAILQGTSRNSLADPGVLGIHAGAGLGLIIFVSFFRTMEGSVSVLIPLFTFTGGVVTALIIFLLSYDRQRGILPIRMILVGIAISAGISAVTLLLSLKLDEDTYTFTATWLAGSVWARDWIHVWTLLPWIVLILPWVYWRSRYLDLFTLGDELASGIGSQVNRSRISLMLLAVALSSASVAMVGSIGFIGLIAPHMARQLAGAQHRYFLPAAALLGVVILLAADTVGRSIFQPNAVPAGVVVAAIGGPYFLYLLFKKY
ncbi:FecCD family ABC transporter permease [Paenibacillus wulumuqiensis]|uniref:FecCD family ABC transporter permease n=1 Tax=Paenibacillus wulumuqiensis TaxID=1567107 RepID=UPI00061966B4|nr:iron ABC transporter permease [Paenibacillus wulumuqiensis]